MKLKQGNMWTAFDEADLFLVTCNSTLRKDGEIVMGRGCALQAKRKFPDLPKAAGKWLQNYQHITGDSDYGILIPYATIADASSEETKLGLFQVKHHFSQPAKLELIERSVDIALTSLDPMYQNVHLNFPGIGYGELDYKSVLPIVERLDNRFTVWTFEGGK